MKKYYIILKKRTQTQQVRIKRWHILKNCCEIRGLSKDFDGKLAVSDLSFEIRAGEILGLVGPNGAGKTTTIKCILGLLKPSSGEILANGVNLNEDKLLVKSMVSYIPEIPVLYDDLTVKEHLRFIAMAYGVERAEYDYRAEQLLKRFGMWESQDEIPTHFSKGMKQKVAILCALVHDAMLILADEPFGGLDPQAVRELKDIFLGVKKERKSILLATHLLDLAERICDRVVIINRGRNIAAGSLRELQNKAGLGPQATLEEIFLNLVGKTDEDFNLLEKNAN